jgi:hypothetical protein
MLMRELKPTTPSASSILLREVLPEIAKALRADLRKIGRVDLAEQVFGLRIYDRCRCASPNCGTFYCAPEQERMDLAGHGTDVGDVTVAKGKIVRVETLSPDVETVLRRIFPERAG